MNDVLRQAVNAVPTTEVGEDWVVIRLPWGADMVSFTFEEITFRSQKFEAVLTVEPQLPAMDDPFRQHISVSSGSNVNAFRLSLDHYFGKEIDWGKLLFQACQKAQRAYIDASQLIEPDDVDLGEAWAWHVERLFIKDRLNIIFGQGESAKSYMAEDIIMACSAQREWLGRQTYESRWIWLDYENPKPEAFAFRRNRLILGGSEPAVEAIKWMSGRGVPVVDLRQTLKREIARTRADGVVIDSLAFACGGDALKQETATSVCNVLNSLGVTVLALAHVDKADNDLYPFGSIFWHNGAHGLTWNVKRVSEEGSDEIAVGWYNRKASDGGRQKSFAVKMRFVEETGPVYVESAELVRTPGLERTATIGAQIWAALYNRKATAKELAERVQTSSGNAAKEDSVRRACERMRDEGILVRSFDDGKVFWSRKSAYDDAEVRS